MSKKFITKPIEPKETRFLSDRTKDKKTFKVGEDKYVIIPLTGLLRQRLYEESDKKVRAKVPIMEGFGWTAEKAANYLKTHTKPLIERSAEDMALITRYMRDDRKAHELAVVDADESLVFEILEECVISINGKAPKDIDITWEEIYSVIDAIEEHSMINSDDKLAL